jgi:hypothetical protein
MTKSIVTPKTTWYHAGQFSLNYGRKLYAVVTKENEFEEYAAGWYVVLFRGGTGRRARREEVLLSYPTWEDAVAAVSRFYMRMT